MVVVVFVEHGGHGSSAAAPLARDLFQKRFGKPAGKPPEPPPVQAARPAREEVRSAMKREEQP